MENPLIMKNLKQNFGHRYFPLSISEIFGAIIIGIAIIIFIPVGIYEIFNKDKDISSLMAIGFLLLMLGFAFYFPDMLRSTAHNATSSMRVAVYMIVAVFVFMCVKTGWRCEKFSDFQLDTTWGYILAAALGGKALQSFAENVPLKNINQQTASVVNTGPNAAAPALQTTTTGDTNYPQNPAPDGPPAYITKLLS